eukprot:g6378.t1
MASFLSSNGDGAEKIDFKDAFVRVSPVNLNQEERRPVSDVGQLEEERRSLKLIRSTGSDKGRTSVAAIRRIKRSSSENSRLLRRVLSDPTPRLENTNVDIDNSKNNDNNLRDTTELKTKPISRFLPRFSVSLRKKSNPIQRTTNASRMQRCGSEIPTRTVEKNISAGSTDNSKYHQSFLFKRNLKAEQLRIKIGRAISSAIETAENEYNSNGSIGESVGKRDEWDKQTFERNRNNIISNTVRNINSLLGVTKKKQSNLLVNYAPKIFKSIRSFQGIRSSSYVFSMCNKPLKPKVFSASASGSFFFETADKRYVLKTITKRECDQLRHMLFDYWKHIERYADTLLPRFMGMYKVKHTENKFVRVLVMRNAFYTKLPISEKYDLKGSTVGRETKDGSKNKFRIQRAGSQHHEHDSPSLNPSNEEETPLSGSNGFSGLGINDYDDAISLKDGIGSSRKIALLQQQKQKIATHTLKDMDLNKFIVIPLKYRNRLLNQCEKDVEFLMKHGIMDYSLLLGIYNHDTDIGYREEQRELKLSVSKALSKSSPQIDGIDSAILLNDSNNDFEIMGSHRKPSFTSDLLPKECLDNVTFDTGNASDTNSDINVKPRLAQLKVSLLSELDDMVQTALIQNSGRISSFSTADQKNLPPSTSNLMVSVGKRREILSYRTVKRKLIEKYGDQVFQECKHDVQTALEELSFRQDRVQPFWNKTRGGMKAFLTPINQVENTGNNKMPAKKDNRRRSVASFSSKSLPSTNPLKKRMSLRSSFSGINDSSIKSEFRSQELSPCVVFIALIDILQVWNVDKKLENAVKTKVIEPILHQNLHADISAIEPALYKDRFLDMIITRVKALEDLGDFSNSHIVKKWLDITDDNDHGANASMKDQCDTSSDKISSSKNRRRSTKSFKSLSGKASKLLNIETRFSDSYTDLLKGQK